jgi:hypothetical protein
MSKENEKRATRYVPLPFTTLASCCPSAWRSTSSARAAIRCAGPRYPPRSCAVALPANGSAAAAVLPAIHHFDGAIRLQEEGRHDCWPLLPALPAAVGDARRLLRSATMVLGSRQRAPPVPRVSAIGTHARLAGRDALGSDRRPPALVPRAVDGGGGVDVVGRLWGDTSDTKDDNYWHRSSVIRVGG